MAFNFPDYPTNGQIYSPGPTWVWSHNAWVQIVETNPALSGAQFFNSYAQAQASLIPSDLQAVFIHGYYSPGDGGDTLYKKVTVQPGHAGKFQSADGAWWEIAARSPVNVKWFGAKGDYDLTTNVGADDTKAIQNAIDYCTYFVRGPEVYIPGGSYKITDTIHLCYDGFRSVTLRGDGYRYRGSTVMRGSDLVVVGFSDRPAVSIQGARGTIVKDLSIYNDAYYQYLTINDFCDFSLGTKDDTIAGNWNNPAMSPTQDARYAPFAGIAIDPRAGAKRPARTITAITNANPGVVTAVGHLITNDEVVYISGVGGMTQLNGYYRIVLIDANSFSLVEWDTGMPVNTSPFGVFSSGGSVQQPMYPDIVYPSYVPNNTIQYGKPPSSDVLIENCYIAGFSVGVAVQPGDSDGNGDFTIIQHSQINFCKWCVSVSNTQSRNVGLINLKMALVFCGITTIIHGRQSGRLQGPVLNCAMGLAIQWFVLNSTAYAGPLVFINCYAEGLWRIGYINSAGSSESAVRFITCHLAFHIQGDSRGHPPEVLEYNPSWLDVMFEGCIFTSFNSVLYFGSASFDGCDFAVTGLRTDLYEKFAHNFLCGGGVSFQLNPPPRHRVKRRRYDLNTGILKNSEFTHRLNGTRDSCIPFFTEAVAASNNNSEAMRPPIGQTLLGAKSSMTGHTLVDRTLTFTVPGRTDQQFMRDGGMPGDVLLDDSTNSVFFVRSRVGTTIIAELQNNYKSNGSGGYVTMNPYQYTVGNFYVGNSRLYTTSHTLFADIATASPVLTNCGRQDGYATFMTELGVGDYIYANDTYDSYILAASCFINARDEVAKTITLNANAGRTSTQKRIQWLVRTPPDNV